MAFNTEVALATLAEVKDFLKKTDDKDLAVLDVIANGVGEFFRQYTGRTLTSKVYTAAVFDGNGWPDFWLPNFPVTSLGTVKEDDDTLVLGTDFLAYLERGRLRRLETDAWENEPQNIVVTYTAGYTALTMPLDLKMAFLVQVSVLWQKFLHNSWDETSRSLASQSVSVNEDAITPFVKTIIERYRRKRI